MKAAVLSNGSGCRAAALFHWGPTSAPEWIWGYHGSLQPPMPCSDSSQRTRLTQIRTNLKVSNLLPYSSYAMSGDGTAFDRAGVASVFLWCTQQLPGRKHRSEGIKRVKGNAASCSSQPPFLLLPSISPL